MEKTKSVLEYYYAVSVLENNEVLLPFSLHVCNLITILFSKWFKGLNKLVAYHKVANLWPKDKDASSLLTAGALQGIGFHDSSLLMTP